jgi:hypothetical protein
MTVRGKKVELNHGLMRFDLGSVLRDGCREIASDRGKVARDRAGIVGERSDPRGLIVGLFPC